jgi:hypothetical protein
MPNAWSALNVGGPHCNGYGMLILMRVKILSERYINMDVKNEQVHASLQTIMRKR